MHRFRELEVYQMAISLTKEIRQLTKKFPKEEMFSLTSQMIRAGDSIALNIIAMLVGLRRSLAK